MIRGTIAAAAALSAALVGLTAGVSGAVGTTTTTSSTSTTTTTTVPSAPSSLPLYSFARTASGPLPWTPSAFGSIIGAPGVSYGPRAVATASGEQLVAYTTPQRTIAMIDTIGTTNSLRVLGPDDGVPLAANAPTPFFDGAGHINLAYVSIAGHVMLVSNDPLSVAGQLGPATRRFHHDWLIRDLSSATSTSALAGQVAVTTSASNDLIAFRTGASAVLVLQVPDARPFSVTSLGTAIASASSDPVLIGPLSDKIPTVAAVASNGHLVVARLTSGTWGQNDLSLGTTPLVPLLTGQLAAGATGSALVVAGTAQSGGALWVATGTLSGASVHFSALSPTALTASATPAGPALSGRLALTLAGATIHVAGRAAGWGDLFDYAGAVGSSTWTATDVSATGGSLAKTVGTQIAAVTVSGGVTLLAPGVATPAPRGVGLYAIPSRYFNQSITDGWRILGDTGGLGTQSSPWVQVTSTPKVSSLDYATGLAIQNSHVRVTWFSFWTISGPIGTETYAPTTFKAHGLAAGAAIARQIDSYRSFGVGVKPDWVILDPEGFPDLHSGLDSLGVSSITGNGSVATVTTVAPTVITKGMTFNLRGTGVSALNVSAAVVQNVLSPTSFTFAAKFSGKVTAGTLYVGSLIRANWAAMLQGWQAGITSVDPSLNAAVYASESEYTTAGLAGTSMPVFVAIAWNPSLGSPVPFSHGNNVLGYVEFGNNCTSNTFQKQLKMLTTAPWNGLYNTVQLDPGLYCKPTAP